MSLILLTNWSCQLILGWRPHARSSLKSLLHQIHDVLRVATQRASRPWPRHLFNRVQHSVERCLHWRLGLWLLQHGGGRAGLGSAESFKTFCCWRKWNQTIQPWAFASRCLTLILVSHLTCSSFTFTKLHHLKPHYTFANSPFLEISTGISQPLLERNECWKATMEKSFKSHCVLHRLCLHALFNLILKTVCFLSTLSNGKT